MYEKICANCGGNDININYTDDMVKCYHCKSTWESVESWKEEVLIYRGSEGTANVKG